MSLKTCTERKWRTSISLNILFRFRGNREIKTPRVGKDTTVAKGAKRDAGDKSGKRDSAVKDPVLPIMLHGPLLLFWFSREGGKRYANHAKRGKS